MTAPSEIAVYCWSCGNQVQIPARFCVNCGKQIWVPRLAVFGPSSPALVKSATAVRDAWVQKHPLLSLPLVLLVIATGTVLGLPGVSIGEWAIWFPYLAAWVAAPLIEEAFKPSGLYVVFLRWPGVLRHQLQTALLAAWAGIVFGLVESWVYVSVYVDDPPDSYVAFRFTVPVLLHALASFTFGLGINIRLRESLLGGRRFSMRNWGFFAAAMVIHSAYNITVTVVEIQFD